MKLGAQKTLTSTILGFAAGVGVILVGRLIMGFVAPAGLSVSQQGVERESGSNFQTNSINLNAFDPTLASDWLRLSEGIQYEGTGRNIFRAEAPLLRASRSPRPKPSPPVAQNPPPSPVLSLRFFGFATPLGGTKRIFLSNDRDVFIGREGEIVNRRCKIVQITPTFVEVEDLINGGVQRLPGPRMITCRAAISWRSE